MKYVRLDKLVELKQGLAINSHTNHLVSEQETNLALLRIADMPTKRKVVFMSHNTPDRYIANEDDIIYTRTGQVGLVFTGQTGVVHNNCFRVIPLNEEILTRKYLYWALNLKETYYLANTFAAGAAQPDLPHSSFKKIKIPYHSLPIQQKIASILSTYGTLIENNTKRIHLLEQMAENLYKEWFVRFRFPGYEKEEMENGLPKEWKISRLQDFGRIETGKTPSMEYSEYYGGNYLFIKTPDMHDTMFVFNTSETLSEEGNNIQKKKLLPINSIMVSCIGSGGVVAINAKQGHTNQQINSIILHDQVYLEWLYFTCKSLKSTIELFGATGATMTNLSKGKFEKLKVIEPPVDIISKFNSISKPLFEQIKNLSKQSRLLTRQRDLLLPRLMSGKLEVKA